MLLASAASTQPSNNVDLVSTLHMHWDAYRIAMRGNIACIAAEESGVVFMDVSDPTAPVEVGYYQTLQEASGIAVQGNFAYVTVDIDGTIVLDISDASMPILVGGSDTPARAVGITVYGDYAYELNWSGGFRILDITDPTYPIQVGALNTPGDSEDIVIAGDYAYMANGDLLIIDVSDPTSPVIVGTYLTPGDSRGVDVSGDRAFVVDYFEGMFVVDISDPTAPVGAGWFGGTEHAVDIKILNDLAYISDGYAGMRIVDVSDPSAPVQISFYDVYGFVWDMAIADGIAYIAGDTGGLRVFDVTDPYLPVEIGYYNLITGTVSDVGVSGNYAFIPDDDAGIQIIDMSDPSESFVASNYDMQYRHTIFINENYAYLDFHSPGYGFCVLDISNPLAPVEIVVYDSLDGSAHDFAISGDLLYVACGAVGLYIMDVSNPSEPVEVGRATPGWSSSVAVQGNYAYLADPWDGPRPHYNSLMIIDVSDPAAPTLLTEFDVGLDGASDVAVRGDYVYQACMSDGLNIIDVSNPAEPFIVGVFDQQYGEATNIELFGNYAFLSYNLLGMRVLDISDPTNPYQVGFFDSPGHAYKTVRFGDYVCLADKDYFHILDHTAATSPISSYLDLTGINTIIPAGGGTLSYDAHFVYGLPYPTPGLAYWAIVETPMGTELGPFVIQPQFTAFPGMDMTVPFSHQVPAGLPAAIYTYFGHVGIFPTTALQDSFTFIKEGAALSESFNWSDVDISSWQTSNGFAQLATNGEPVTGQPTSYSLEAAYPNPFNPSTSISVNLPESAELEVAVYNVVGQLVTSLADGQHIAGQHVFTFDGHDLASGVYLVQATVPGKLNEVQKIVLMK